MDSKRKMIISITVFAVAILAIVITMVSVLAAQNVTVNSSINITYTADKIKGVVTGHYSVAGDANVKIGEINYLGTEDDGAKNLNNGTLNISGVTKTKNYVEFIFTFTNSGSTEYTATLKFTDNTAATSLEDDNIAMAYKGGLVTDYANVTTGTNGVYSLGQLTVPAGTSTPISYYVKVSIPKTHLDASFSGSFAWNIAL